MEFLSLDLKLLGANQVWQKDDDSTLGEVLFWALLLLFVCFDAYAVYATHHVLSTKSEKTT